MVFLPEASDYIGSSPDETKSLCRSVHESAFAKGLQEDAKKHSIAIAVGVHEPSDDKDSKRLKNTSLWIDDQGQISQRYQKVHLFDLDVEDGPKMKESNIMEPGREILTPFPTVLGKVGCMICFDLRFPEIALSLKRQGADVLLYPSAFTPETGKVHWHTLLKARAIETQCFVIAAAQVGAHNEKRSSYGHSIAIGPWGEVIAELGEEKKDEPEVLIVEIDLERIKTVRKGMPQSRRTFVALSIPKSTVAVLTCHPEISMLRSEAMLRVSTHRYGYGELEVCASRIQCGAQLSVFYWASSSQQKPHARVVLFSPHD